MWPCLEKVTVTIRRWMAFQSPEIIPLSQIGTASPTSFCFWDNFSPGGPAQYCIHLCSPRAWNYAWHRARWPINAEWMNSRSKEAQPNFHLGQLLLFLYHQRTFLKIQTHIIKNVPDLWWPFFMPEARAQVDIIRLPEHGTLPLTV